MDRSKRVSVSSVGGGEIHVKHLGELTEYRSGPRDAGRRRRDRQRVSAACSLLGVPEHLRLILLLADGEMELAAIATEISLPQAKALQYLARFAGDLVAPPPRGPRFLLRPLRQRELPG